MDLFEELRIEYKRLCRNLNDIEIKWNEHVARDLVAGLRNWVQLSSNIDQLADELGWKLKFPAHVKTKAEKKSFKDGSEGFHTPGTVINGGSLIVADVRFHNRALSQEEIMSIVKAGPPSGPPIRLSTFSSWLDGEVYEMKSEGKRIGVSRREYICRCANVLGGTHPASTYVPERNEQVFDRQILELLNTSIAGIPAPWAFINEGAKGISSAFENYLDS